MAKGAVPGAHRMAVKKRVHHGGKGMHGGRRGGGKSIKRMTIEPTANGGYIVDHQHSDEPWRTDGSSKHAIGSAADLHAHVAQHFPAGDDEGAEAMPDDETAE